MNKIHKKDFSTILADRSRLTIMAYLAANKKSDFTNLCAATQLTKGNLSSHMLRLEKQGYVKVSKEFVNRKPCTTYTCTIMGKNELKKYLIHIEEILREVV